jgi:hypothetical protein
MACDCLGDSGPAAPGDGKIALLSWENIIARVPLRSAISRTAALCSVPQPFHNSCRPPTCTPCSTWPSRPPAPPARSSTAPRLMSNQFVSRRSRSTTSSPKSTTPARLPSSKPCWTAYPGSRHLAEESGKPSMASQGFGIRLDHRSAGRHHQLHPRFPGLLRQHCAGRQGQGRAGRASTTPAATTFSQPPRAAAPT